MATERFRVMAFGECSADRRRPSRGRSIAQRQRDRVVTRRCKPEGSLVVNKAQKRAKQSVNRLEKAIGTKAPKRVKRRMRKLRKAVARLVS